MLRKIISLCVKGVRKRRDNVCTDSGKCYSEEKEVGVLVNNKDKEVVRNWEIDEITVCPMQNYDTNKNLSDSDSAAWWCNDAVCGMV